VKEVAQLGAVLGREFSYVLLGGCPRINTHPCVGRCVVSLVSALARFCRLGDHLNTARGTVPDAIPPRAH
jgi:hypothetical protein